MVCARLGKSGLDGGDRPGRVQGSVTMVGVAGGTQTRWTHPPPGGGYETSKLPPASRGGVEHVVR